MKTSKGLKFITLSILVALSMTSCSLSRKDDTTNKDNSSDTDKGNTDSGNTSGGDSAGGNTSGGDSTGGNTSGGDSAGGNTSGGDSTGGNTSGGDSTGGNTSGGDGDSDTLVETFTITYVVNGGTEVTSATINKGSVVQNIPTTTKTGYTFDGWYSDKSLTTIYDFSKAVTSNVTLYAKWTEIKSGDIINTVSGYAEGIYAIFNETTPTSSAIKVEVKKSSDSTYTRIDNNLVRSASTSTARVDVLGLSAGLYDLKVTNSSGEYEERTNIQVSAYDRSGYAHFNKTDGVGAYNDDGTLKNNAVVVYVNDSNKNSVEATIAGKTYTGLANIMQAQYKSNYPLVIRFLGSVKTTQWNYIDTASVYGAGNTEARVTKQNTLFNTASGWASNKLTESYIISNGLNSMSNDINNGITKLNGLTNRIIRSTTEEYGSNSYVYDSYFNDLDVGSAKNVTIEGVGDDAELYQWGFTFSKCNSLEVRNLTFTSYTEDAIGIQGGSNSDMDYSAFWIHNSTFNPGVNNWDVTDENDKKDGDGSTDFKYAHNLTISYVRYNKTHKTALIGGGDNHCQYNLTFHHNFYNQCSSRQPLLRQANVHMYNNYYYKSSTAQDIRANAFAYSEYNYFDNCTAAQKVTTNDTYTKTAIKSYNDEYSGSNNTTAATKVTSRDTTVSGLCKPDNGKTDYTNFDTSTSLFYYDSVNKVSKVAYLSSASQAKLDCQNYAGATSKYNVISQSTDTIDKGDDSDTTTSFTTVLNEDFSSDVSVTTLTSNTVPTTQGIYMYTNAADDTNNYIKVDDNKLLIYDDSESTTYGYYIYQDTYDSGIVKYSIDFTPQTKNGSWTFISFITDDGEIGLRTDSNKNIGVTTDGTNITTLNTAIAENTTYSFTLTVNYNTNTMTITLLDNTVSLTKANSISGIKFMTAGSASRSFSVDNIKVEKSN